jgi:hypothetical protein
LQAVWPAPTPAIHDSAPRVFAVEPRDGARTAELIARLRERAATEPAPDDWCYVHHFADPDTPRAIRMPPGGARRLQHDVDRSLEVIRSALRDAFDDDDHRERRRGVAAALRAREERALTALRTRARERDVALVREAARIVVVPLRDGVPLSAETLAALPKAERARRTEVMARIAHELELLLRDCRLWAREADAALERLGADAARCAVRSVLEPLRSSYAAHPAVLEHLTGLEDDVIAHAEELAERDAPGVEGDAPAPRRYRIRVLTDHSVDRGAPVVYEPHPTYASLIGRVEPDASGERSHWVHGGALHRALGGYLVLEADELARHPAARLAVTRTIESGEIALDPLACAMRLAKRRVARPDSIPFTGTTIVLNGEAHEIARLATVDPKLMSQLAG